MKNFTTRLRGSVRLCVFLAVLQPLCSHVLHAVIHPFPIQQEVYGRVQDVQGMPLAGVTVQFKSRSGGSLTQTDGTYQLQAVPGDTLLFRYMGFRTEQRVVGAEQEVNVQLTAVVNDLEEILVNAGYYRVKEREQTGNISRITSEELERQPVLNPLLALQGRMAGVSVVQKTGVPGNAVNLQIRGTNSLRSGFGNNGNLPLYIVDGVPIDATPLNSFSGLTSPNIAGIDPLNTINPGSIERIEVLKDADATAIYGSRGANGVILITTKQGKSGEQPTRIRTQIYSGVGQVAQRISLAGTADYLSLRREAFANDGVTPTPINAPDLNLWDAERTTDWQDALFGGTAQIRAVSVGVSGGSATTHFQLGAGYQGETSVFPGASAYRKLSANLNLTHTSADQRFMLKLNSSFGTDRNRLFDGGNFVSDALSLPPNAPALYTEDGSLNWESSSWTNPLAPLYRESTAVVQQLISSLSLRYTVSPKFVVKLQTGYTFLASDEVVKQPIRFYDPLYQKTARARSLHLGADRKSWIVEPQVEYTSGFGALQVEALAGSTFQKRTGSSLQVVGTGYAQEQLLGNLAAASLITVTENRNTDYAYAAVFGRVGLNLHRRYFLNLTGRRDGSSRFGSSRRFANFGAVGAAWIVSDEAWMVALEEVISFAKLRGSYGVTGSDQIGDYGYLDTYSATPGGGGLYPTQLTNPDYSWEQNRKLELALELGFFKNRLNLSASGYRNRSSNQLVGLPLPALTGFTTVQANLGALVENSGWEVELHSRNLKTDLWNWESFLNVSFPKNELVSFPGIAQSAYATQYRVGESLNIQLLYESTGVDAETGLYTVTDINGDGVYTFEDRIVVKDLGRTVYGGLRNQLSYRRLHLDFLWEFVKQEGQQYFPVTAPGRLGAFLQEDYGQRWQAPGDVASIQKASQGFPALRSYSQFRTSDGALTDASFLRLKTLGIHFQLPVAHLKVESCTLFIQGQNLLTFTAYRGLDPQSPGTNLPALRMLTAGVNLNF